MCACACADTCFCNYFKDVQSDLCIMYLYIFEGCTTCSNMLHLLTTVDTPSQKSPTPSQNSPATVIILLVVAAVIIMILLVIITILSVLLILKRNKQPPTVHCDQVNMSEIYYEADIMKTNQDYQELDVSQMDDDVMTSSKDYQKLNVRKMDPLDDEVINKKGNIGLEAIKKEDVIFAKKTMKN